MKMKEIERGGGGGGGVSLALHWIRNSICAHKSVNMIDLLHTVFMMLVNF